MAKSKKCSSKKEVVTDFPEQFPSFYITNNSSQKLKIKTPSFTPPLRAPSPDLLQASTTNLKEPHTAWRIQCHSCTISPIRLHGWDGSWGGEGPQTSRPLHMLHHLCAAEWYSSLEPRSSSKRETRTAGTQHSSNKWTVLSGRTKKAKEGAATWKFMLPEAMITFASEQFTHTHRREKFLLHVCCELAI